MRKSYSTPKSSKQATLIRRKLGIRKKIVGTKERPRICVVTSNKHLSVQVIDDSAGRTVLSVQTYGKKPVANSCNLEGAGHIGKAVGVALKEKGYTRAVFDRNGKLFGKKLATIVQNIRENGIQI